MTERVLVGLDELWQATHALLAGCDDREWMLPTPCADWSVRQLVAHIAAGQSSFEGLPQPEPPAAWSTEKTGVDAVTAYGVAARDDWTPKQVLNELSAATAAQVARLCSLDESAWGDPAPWPPGDPTVRGFAKNRLLDGYIHLLDLRVALGRPFDLQTEPTAFLECVDQALEFSGWGAVKKAGIVDDCRIGLELSGIGERNVDLVISDRRGRLEPHRRATKDRVTGSAAALLFSAVDRRDWIDDVGGLVATGATARQFVDGYVIWL